MIALLGSRIKEQILMLLGQRGGQSGRQIAKELKSSPTPVFKALTQLKKNGIVSYDKWHNFSYYYLNTEYIYYQEIIQMIHKNSIHFQKKPFSLKIPHSRQIDAISVLKLIELRGHTHHKQKLSDTLREKYG